MKILLHQCCGPCSIYPIEVLKSKSFEITTFFYNPNIHLIYEFYKRLEGAVEVSEYYGLDTLISKEYGLEQFLDKSFSDKNKRCLFCYELRITNIVKVAHNLGYEYVTSSLLYSKYQSHDKITKLFEKYANMYQLQFYYFDFREGWRYGIDKSKELNIYRQQYCGCIFSEKERYENQLSKDLDKRFAKKSFVEVLWIANLEKS